MKKNVFLLIFALLGISAMNTAHAQTYDPLAVQRINDLIANNGLQATPNAPETWEFAEWNDETPKQVIYLNLDHRELIGIVSLEGLKTLETLNCSYNNSFTKLNLKNCTLLRRLFCDHNSSLTKIVVTNCTHLSDMYLYFNSLIELDLTGINGIGNFGGSHQNVPLTLNKNEAGEYSCFISLNNPTFDNNAISYSDGILKSKDNTVIITNFTVQTNSEYYRLRGNMNFTYSDVGINEQNGEQLKVYPSPANDTLFIEYKDSTQITVMIYDIHGKKVLTDTTKGKTEIDISHLSKGTYVVNILSEGKIIGNAKIIKQ
jgi:hypothetical protein